MPYTLHHEVHHRLRNFTGLTASAVDEAMNVLMPYLDELIRLRSAPARATKVVAAATVDLAAEKFTGHYELRFADDPGDGLARLVCTEGLHPVTITKIDHGNTMQRVVREMLHHQTEAHTPKGH